MFTVGQLRSPSLCLLLAGSWTCVSSRSPRTSSTCMSPLAELARQRCGEDPPASSSLTVLEVFISILCLFPCDDSTLRLSCDSVKALSLSISVTTIARVESDTGSKDVIVSTPRTTQEVCWKTKKQKNFVRSVPVGESTPQTIEATN